MTKFPPYRILLVLFAMVNTTYASPIENLTDSLSQEIRMNLSKNELKFSKIQVDSPIEKYIVGNLIKESDKSTSNVLVFRLLKAEINYNTLSDDSLQRFTNIYATVLLDITGEKSLLIDKTYAKTDTITFAEAKEYEQELGIKESNLPKEKSLYKKYFQPILIATVAVVTAFVFFTVRSK